MEKPGSDVGEDHHPHCRRRSDIARIIRVQNRHGGQRRIGRIDHDRRDRRHRMHEEIDEYLKDVGQIGTVIWAKHRKCGSRSEAATVSNSRSICLSAMRAVKWPTA